MPKAADRFFYVGPFRFSKNRVPWVGKEVRWKVWMRWGLGRSMSCCRMNLESSPSTRWIFRWVSALQC